MGHLSLEKSGAATSSFLYVLIFRLDVYVELAMRSNSALGASVKTLLGHFDGRRAKYYKRTGNLYTKVECVIE